MGAVQISLGLLVAAADVGTSQSAFVKLRVSLILDFIICVGGGQEDEHVQEDNQGSSDEVSKPVVQTIDQFLTPIKSKPEQRKALGTSMSCGKPVRLHSTSANVWSPHVLSIERKRANKLEMLGAQPDKNFLTPTM